MTSSSSPVSPGDVIAGKYMVECVLGAGGMGVVVAAIHQALGERVAIKLLQPEALKNEEVVARFLREGRAAARFRSEHVARVYDVGTLPDGTPYIVMEYLDGRDLGALLVERGPLGWDVAVDYILQACEALAEVHAAGVVHRDLKPANLFLVRRSDGTPGIKIIDFGISKLASEVGALLDSKEITHPSALMGSPLYMAPEQMASARDADARSDIWSLGAIFYHLVAGAPPFDGSSVLGLYDSLAKGPPKLRADRPEVPAAVDAIIARCLTKDRAGRFPDVAVLAAELAPLAPPEARSAADRIARILGAPEAPRPVSSTNEAKMEARAPALDAAMSEVEQAKDPRYQRPTDKPPSAPAAPSSKTVREASVEDAVGEALGGFGVAGKVVLNGKYLELHGRGAPVEIDVERIGEQWPLLPPEMKRRRATELARRLAEARRAVDVDLRPAPGGSPDAVRLLGRVAAAVVILGAIGVGARIYLARAAKPPAEEGVRPETKEEEKQRLERVCEAMRANMYKGAPPGAYEVGGWAVELWLASHAAPGPEASPAIAGAVRDGKIAPGIDEALSAVKDGSLALEDGAGTSGWRAVKLTFTGGYTRAFFEPEGRSRFLALADRLAEGSGAEVGALYGRCAHLAPHDVGAWFRGRDAGLTAAALLYGIGLFAEPKVVDRALFAKLGGGGDLDALKAAASAAKLDANGLKAMTAEAGGVTAQVPSGVTLTFPVGGPIRALRASKAVAKKLGLGGGE